MRWRTLKTKKQSYPQLQKAKTLFAPFWPRAAGFVTDIFMIGLPISLLTMAIFGYDQMHTASGLDVLVHDPKAQSNPPNPIASITQISLFLITYVWLWHVSGQTPGKKALPYPSCRCTNTPKCLYREANTPFYRLFYLPYHPDRIFYRSLS